MVGYGLSETDGHRPSSQAPHLPKMAVWRATLFKHKNSCSVGAGATYVSIEERGGRAMKWMVWNLERGHAVEVRRLRDDRGD